MALVTSYLSLPPILKILLLITYVSGQYFTNVAYNKTASQSSVGFNATADRAVDGNTTTNWLGGSCTSTAEADLEPWWMVDMGESYNVSQLIITNRGDCCGNRLHDFFVELFVVDPTTDNKTKGILCTEQTEAVPNGFTVVFPCATGSYGRYLRIRKTGVISDTDVLTLCEVHVLGTTYKQECPEGFISDEKKCYYFSKKTTDWYKASFRCQNLDSNLVLPMTNDEDEDLSNLLAKKAKSGETYWLGAKELNAPAGTWKTVDTGEVGLKYTNWELQDRSSCVITSQAAEFKWETKPCASSHLYICCTPIAQKP